MSFNGGSNRITLAAERRRDTSHQNGSREARQRAGNPGFHHGHTTMTIWVTLAKSLHSSIRAFSQLLIQKAFIVLNTYYVFGAYWVHRAPEEQSRQTQPLTQGGCHLAENWTRSQKQQEWIM